MAKMRVHELAKELNISNNDIKETLARRGINVKSHMSAVDDDMIAYVKKFYGKSDPAPKQETAPKAEADKKTEVKDNRVVKDTKETVKPARDTKEAEKPRFNNKADGHTKFVSDDKARSMDRQKSGERVRFVNNDRSNSDRPRYNNDRSNGDRPNGDRPRYNNGDRSNGDRPRYNNGDRPNGDRPRYNNDRSNGDRPNGDRPRYNNGDRPNGDRRYNNGDGSDRNRFGGSRDNRFSNNNYGRNGGMSPAFGKDDDDQPTPQRRKFKGNDRKDFDAKEVPGRDLKSQNRDNYNRDKNKPRKGNRKSELEVEADISRLAKNVKNKPVKHEPVKEPVEAEDTIRSITLPEVVTIKELADALKTPVNALIKKLFLAGKMVNVNSELDFDSASEIALEYNCIAEEEEKVDVIEELLKEDEEDEKDMVPRPPVVCVMGHVDHGKTSLLDAIRETNVTRSEAGGITQAIGASVVNINGQTITFLDTPGHEAFTAMRMRGAQSTDIAILVVAADDGVMPQTVEAINHAKAAGIEIIVAINKIDKESANIERVKQELTEYELIPEDWGGSTIFCPVSAHTKEGIDNLLEMILLTAEVLELKANPDRKARGIVIEAELDKGRGPVASILVQKGTLHVGDAVSAGSCYGKIRAMIDDKGNRVKVAGPSTPVEILGLNDVPNAGEIIMAADSEKEARSTAETFISEGRKKLLDDTKHKVSLDALFEQIQAGNMKELNIIIKADVQGSVEAVKSSLVRLSNDEVVVKVIHGGVGNVNESDVVLASASNAIIIAFNVKPDNQARIVAEREKVDLRLYSVIYNAIEDVEAALKGMLEPIYEEKIIGHARIMQIFKASGVGNIAGCIVEEGRITRDSVVRITRGSEKVYEGPIASLKHFKDEVKEIKAGTECGMVFEKFNDIQPEDMIEAHIMVEVPR